MQQQVLIEFDDTLDGTKECIVGAEAVGFDMTGLLHLLWPLPMHFGPVRST